MNRKTRFWIGFSLIVLTYGFLLATVIIVLSIWMLTVISMGFFLSVYLLYFLTIKKRKPKYPLLPPEGHPDIYTAAGVPRPIHEDMEQYPWLFKKKHQKEKWAKKKVKKKH
jgi:hypothetical protein